jgi:CO/xanthine dehydrogenase FAD-binding subunit
MQPFAYARPETEEEVLGLLAAYGPEARLLAGGTDLVVGLRNGEIRPKIVIDLKRVVELRPGITETDGRFAVAATTVLADLVADVRIRQHFPALVQAALTVGSVQIRHRATLAGNICNASPAADTAPALLAYGTDVVLASAEGRRRVALEHFFIGPGRTVLRRGELVASIELPVPDRPFGSAFGRLTRRRGVDLATISLCCFVDASGDTRFGYGAVGPRPFVVADTSRVLADPATTTAEREEVLERMTAQANPISDVRASREYRRAMLLVLSRRLLRVATRLRAGS